MTQNARILAILSDGDWHEKSEFYGFCVLHSRVAELRQRGENIQYRRDGDRHLYRRGSLRAVEIPVGDDGFSAARSDSTDRSASPPTAPGHAAVPGPASSGATPDPELLDALDWINRELAKGTAVPSDNARTRRDILQRQKTEIEARL